MSSFRGLCEVIAAKGCSARSLPTVTVIADTRRTPAVRWTMTIRSKSAAPSPGWVSRSLRPARPGRGDGPNACSRACRDACLRELRLADITELETANRFLEEHCLPRRDARLRVPVEARCSAFVTIAGALEDILRIQAKRTAANDHTVRYKGRSCRSPPIDTAIIASRPGSGFTNSPKAQLPSSMYRNTSPPTHPGRRTHRNSTPADR